MSSLLISIIIWLVATFLVYWCFENYGFWAGYVVYVVDSIITSASRGQVIGVSTVLGALIVALISTAISHWLYKKSDSFGKFVLYMILLGIVVAVIVAILVISLGVSVYNMANGAL